MHGGEYREWVQPRRGGLSDQRRITYTAAPGEHVVIKGSERVTGWELRGRWRLEGRGAEHAVRRLQPVRRGARRGLDRLRSRGPRRSTSGDVYLNGAQLLRGRLPGRGRRTRRGATQDVDDWTGSRRRSTNPEQTRARVVRGGRRGARTTIWANFQGADPNTELVEINVRRSVFYPDRASPGLHHRPRVRAGAGATARGRRRPPTSPA